MRMSVIELTLPPTRLLTVCGELDLATANTLERAVATCLSDGCDRVLLDLAGVTLMDSSGLHALSTSSRLVARVGGTLRIVALSTAVERVLLPSDFRRALTVGGLAAS